jgi:hypothetical protein
MRRGNYLVAVTPIEMAAACERQPAQYKWLPSSPAAWKTRLTLQEDAAEDPPPQGLLQQRRRERGISPSTCCRPRSPRETRANTAEWQVAPLPVEWPHFNNAHCGPQMAPHERVFEVFDEWWVSLQSHTGLRIFTHYCRVNFSPLVSMVSSA